MRHLVLESILTVVAIVIITGDRGGRGSGRGRGDRSTDARKLKVKVNEEGEKKEEEVEARRGSRSTHKMSLNPPP